VTSHACPGSLEPSNRPLEGVYAGHRNRFFHGVMESDDHGIFKSTCQLVTINYCEVTFRAIFTRGSGTGGGSTMYLRSMIVINDERARVNKLP